MGGSEGMSARRSRPGSVLMEFIIVAPLMLILISMILQFAQIWIAREITAYAAYCACRSVLSAANDERGAAHGAQKAAELACSWMCLAGLPGVTGSTGGDTETIVLPRFHDREDISDSETVDFDNGSWVKGEVVIPGWGTIPGSDSAGDSTDNGIRVVVNPSEIVLGPPYARVTVHFKFPMLMPLTGRMLSLFVNSDDTSEEGEAGKIDYGNHELTGGNNPAWQGETYVMDKNGNRIKTDSSVSWGSDGRFPYIELTETAVLPMSYRVDFLATEAYAEDLQKYGGGS